MKHEYRVSEDFKAIVHSCTDDLDFDTAWQRVNSGDTQRFPVLQQFCGDLATVFPNTATVESDCSVIGWEKSEDRVALSDLSLEGILHCKQINEVASLGKAISTVATGSATE